MTREITSKSRLRFAPSPTGALHVGGARTALFNWLLARGAGATYILRIEDTDRERSTEEAVHIILDGLKWLGLDWDEGPFYQSQRGDHYTATVKALVERGRAYPCFCPEARMDGLREAAKAANKPFIYDGHCRGIDPAEAARRAAAEPHAIRFRIEPGRTEFDDLIGGARGFDNDLLGDFVIQRTDGSPIYQLTVVVDDYEMGVTHVVRGDDHLSNTPRQIQIFNAMGWTPPHYGHLPLIQGTDRARLSKRHGATSVLEFAREGILPEAMFNYLALLGWSLDDKTELMTREELTKNFCLERINHSAAIFDHEKLRWMNGVYLRQKPLPEIAALARASFLEAGMPAERLPEPWFTGIVALEVERARTMDEMRENLGYFFADRLPGYDEKGAAKHFMADGAETLLARLEEELAAAPSFEVAELEARLREAAERLGVGFGKLVHPLRLALTGRTASPGIFDVLAGVGRAKSIERLLQAREWIQARKSGAPA